MRRPLPIIPRGPKRRTAKSNPAPLLLACPRIAPDWELAALRALVKPQFKGRILHRASRQKWPRNGVDRVKSATDAVSQRLHYAPTIHFPDDGDYFFVAQIGAEDYEQALGLALLLSGVLPGVWLTIGRLFLLDGKFFQKRLGRRFQLCAACGIHLRRPIRAALRDLL